MEINDPRHPLARRTGRQVDPVPVGDRPVLLCRDVPGRCDAGAGGARWICPRVIRLVEPAGPGTGSDRTCRTGGALRTVGPWPSSAAGAQGPWGP
jgi:hypothetical protein